MKDLYIFGNTDRISQEAPVPILGVKKNDLKAGGAANVALNAAALGLKVTILSIVGEDKPAEEIERILKSQSVNCIFIRCSNTQTVQKHRIISQNQQILRIDYEAGKSNEGFSGDNYLKLFSYFKKEVDSEKHKAIILSDYKKGVLAYCKRLISTAKKKSIPVFVDPKGASFSNYKYSTFLKPNLKEFERVVGSSVSRAEFNSKAVKLKNILNVDNLLITKGQSGMLLFQGKKAPLTVSAHNSKEVFDVTGAGDTVLATIVAATANNYSLVDAVKIASVSAGIAVSKFGTSSISSNELKAEIINSSGITSSLKINLKLKKNDELFENLCKRKTIKGKKELGIFFDHIKTEKKSIVFTNGCFDIIHAGHIFLLEKAKKFGDFLVVGLNSDKSVKQLKGENRPINGEKDRINVLKSIMWVDFVVVFKEKTPYKIIETICPNVLVKGGDYLPNEIIGSDLVKRNGGKIKIVPFKKGLSSTNVMKKI